MKVHRRSKAHQKDLVVSPGMLRSGEVGGGTAGDCGVRDEGRGGKAAEGGGAGGGGDMMGFAAVAAAMLVASATALAAATAN